MIRCEICNRRLRAINSTHLRTHNLSVGQYRDRFPEAPLKCKELIEENARQLKSITSDPAWREEHSRKMAGSNNPFHGRYHTPGVRAVMSVKQLQMRLDGVVTTPENFRTYMQKNPLVDPEAFAEGGGKKADRQKSLRAYGHACLVCGFSEAVHNHHIFGSKVSRKVEGMIILCPNHHALADSGQLTVEHLTKLAHDRRARKTGAR